MDGYSPKRLTLIACNLLKSVDGSKFLINIDRLIWAHVDEIAECRHKLLEPQLTEGHVGVKSIIVQLLLHGATA